MVLSFRQRVFSKYVVRQYFIPTEHGEQPGEVKPNAGYGAPATDKARAKTYYHGTPTTKKANAIWQEGIKPDLSKNTGASRPVAGRVYITENLSYAIMYALGGNFAGSACWNSIESYGPHAYIFKIDGKQLDKIFPDEDQVGEAVHVHYNDARKFPWMDDYEELLKEEEPEDPELFSNLLDEVQDGLYDAWIRAGHVLLPKLTDTQKYEIMEHFGNVAHEGTLHPHEMWAFDRNDCKQLNRDGSNFFTLATRVKVR